jgi:hypothetical protein
MRQQQRRQFKRPRTGYLSQSEVDRWHTTLSAIEERRVQPNPVTPQERHQAMRALYKLWESGDYPDIC